MSKLIRIASVRDLARYAQEELEGGGELRWRDFTVCVPECSYNAEATFLFDDVVIDCAMKLLLVPTRQLLEQFSHVDTERCKVLVTTSISESIIKQCKELGLACVDLNGRAYIRHSGVLIDRAESEAKRYKSSRGQADIFSLKSSRVVRALLSNPERKWSQKHLAEETKLSKGLVSRLIKSLEEQGFIVREKRSISLPDTRTLLEAWTKSDDLLSRSELRRYSLPGGSLDEIAQSFTATCPKESQMAYTQWYAAIKRQPYMDPPVVTAYVSSWPVEAVLKKLQARQVDEGGKLWLLLPYDEGVFQFKRQMVDYSLVSDAQVYLDLVNAGMRGPDQAKALLEWEGFCK